MVKNPLTNAGDTRDVGSIPGLGRSPGIGNGNPFLIPGKYPCLDTSRILPKSLQMETAAMKLKDAYSLEGKL